MQSATTVPSRLVHVEHIAIRWGDMDAMGHVNNAVYFRYMEQARIRWFETLLPQEEAWRAIGIVIVNASCNFRKPINYPGSVQVRVRVGAPGGSSVPTYYELVIDEEPYADGAATVVFIDMEKHKPIRIPQKIREAIQ